MSLKKNESDIEHIAYSDRKVYSVLSDLRNLKKLESNFEDEEKRRMLIAQLGEEKVKKSTRGFSQNGNHFRQRKYKCADGGEGYI